MQFHRAPACVLFPLFALGAQAQESKALFDAPIVTAGPTERYEILSDLDADGWTDAVGVWLDINVTSGVVVRGYLNDHTGRLASSWQIPIALTSPTPTTWSVATGDLDRDGLPEVVVGIGSQLRILRSTGGGLVSGAGVAATTYVGPQVMGVLVDDYDSDGVLDVAVLHGALTIYHVDPTTLALTPFTELFSGVTVAQLHAVEMNGDGVPDLMVTDAQNVSLYAVTGGQLQPPLIFAHGCADPKPAAGDIDGDGDQDVVVWDMGSYTVLRRINRAGYYIAEYGHAGGPARFLYDLDGDGDLDGVCCGGSGPITGYNWDPSIFRLSFNDGHGSFAPALELPGLGSFKLAGAADLDHDGDLDLVAGRTVFYAHGPWSRVAAPSNVEEPWPQNVVDFDGDADADLLLRTNVVGRNLRDARPSDFHPQLPVLPAGQFFSSQAYVGDFDGDGDADMVVARRSNPSTFLGMTLLVNESGGSFADGGDATPPGTPLTSAGLDPEERVSLTADFDGDGDLDIVAVSLVDDRTCLWANDGTGHFTAGAVLVDSYVQAVADIDGDGIPDLVGHHTPYTGVWYDWFATWRGLGGGAFAPFSYSSNVLVLDKDRDRMAVGDVDGDGDVDVVMATWGSVVVQRNNLSAGVTDMGWGQFSVEGISPASVTGIPTTTSLFDVNGDGRLDIVVGPANGSVHYAPNAPLIYLRRADNSGWEAPVLQVLSASAFADADGDGDIDAIGSRVWLNTHIGGRSASTCLQTASGVPDHNGLTPTLGGHGPYRLGEHVDIRLTGAPAQKNGVLLVTVGAFAQQPTFPVGAGGSLVKAGGSVVHFHTSGIAGGPGTGSWTLPFTVPPYVVNTTRTYVAIMADPLVPGGRVVSNQFAIHYAP